MVQNFNYDVFLNDIMVRLKIVTLKYHSLVISKAVTSKMFSKGSVLSIFLGFCETKEFSFFLL